MAMKALVFLLAYALVVTSMVIVDGFDREAAHPPEKHQYHHVYPPSKAPHAHHPHEKPYEHHHHYHHGHHAPAKAPFHPPHETHPPHHPIKFPAHPPHHAHPPKPHAAAAGIP
ncbi:hypothetical protein U1Q18_038419 [Sarracenia purpurea var. burkii]